MRVGIGTSNSIPAGALTEHRVRVAQGQLEVRAPQLGAVADALDLQRLLVALGHPVDHVGHQRAGQAVQRAVLAAIGGALDHQLVVLLLDGDVARDALGQLALGAVDAHQVGLHGHGHAGGHGNGLSADAGLHHHTSAISSPPTPARRRVVAGHHTAGGGDDRGAHPALHLGDVARVDVHAPARSRDPAQPGDHRAAVGGVAQVDAQPVAGARRCRGRPRGRSRRCSPARTGCAPARATGAKRAPAPSRARR